MLCSNNIWINNLKDAIISELASKSPSMAANPELIHLRLQQFLPTFQTPTHPPYSSMIREALLKLNEECGSSEEDISRFLEKEFEGLPCAHATFLTHHLEKLCGNGEILRVGNERYMVSLGDGDVGEEDRALVQGKGNRVDGSSVVNGVPGAESENRCQVEEQLEGRRESIEEVREGSQIEENRHLEKLCGNGEILTVGNERYTVNLGDGDVGEEDRALVEEKGDQVDDSSVVNGVRGPESENRCQVEEQLEGRRESIEEVRGGSQIEENRHLEKLCGNGEILSVGNERYMVNLGDGDVGKEDRALVQGKGNQVDGSSVVNGVRGAESKNQCQVEEQLEGGKESIEKVREESQIEASHHLENLCGNREIECIDKEHGVVCTDDCDLGNKEEMSHRLNISNSYEKEDRVLVQVKEVEVEAINSSGGVNGDRAAESENQCENETLSVEVSGQNNVYEQRTEGFEDQNMDRMEPLKEVQEESQNFSGQIEVSHHYETHCEIDCTNNEQSMVRVDEETCHQFSISDRGTKEDQTFVQVKEREVEAINGWSGVNGDRAEESENQCEDGTHSMEVSGQNKASEQRTDGSEEQNEGRTEPLKEVQEECRNFKGQIEVAEEVDVAKGKLTKAAPECWGQKRKRKQKTKRKIKVLKDDIPEPMMVDEERPQKIKRGSGVKKFAGEQEQPQKTMCGSGVKISAGEQKLPLKTRLRSGVKESASEQERSLRGKMIGEQGHSLDSKIDIKTKKPVFPCDGENVKRLKTSFPKRSVRLSEKQKKEGLKHEEQLKRNLFIVCALPATQSRTNMDSKAHMLPTDSRSPSPESSEWGEVLLRNLKRSTCRRPADLRGNVSKRFTQSEPKPNSAPKNSEEFKEKQELQFNKPEKLGEYDIKTKQASFCSKEAEDSMDQGHQSKRIKVYVRRNARKSQLKEAGNFNILSSDSK